MKPHVFDPFPYMVKGDPKQHYANWCRFTPAKDWAELVGMSEEQLEEAFCSKLNDDPIHINDGEARHDA